MLKVKRCAFFASEYRQKCFVFLPLETCLGFCNAIFSQSEAKDAAFWWQRINSSFVLQENEIFLLGNPLFPVRIAGQTTGTVG